MILKFLILLSVVLVIFVPAYAEVVSVTTNKSSYNEGDTLTVSGKVNVDPEVPFVIIQILTPNKDNFAGVSSILPSNDGSFSDSFHVGGPTWPGPGTYTVKISYGGISETSFDFVQDTSSSPSGQSSNEQNPSNPPPQNNTPSENIQEKQNITPKTNEQNSQKPKTHIPGFPSLEKSPQYYIDRYNTESDYKSWFDSQFPGESIEDVVGYDSTHIPEFPSVEYSPQYYIARYNTEPDYKSWFDSQFFGQTIYQVLGFPNPEAVPSWIKNNAEWWSTGQITDSDFLDGIEFMVENHIIIIQSMPKAPIVSDQEVPNWIRNNAHWWAQDKISEEEFVNAIKFLIQNGIIVV